MPRTFVLATSLTLGMSALALVIFDFEGKIPNATDLVPDPLHSLVYVPLFLGGIACFVCGRKNRATWSSICGIATLLVAVVGLYANIYSLDRFYSARFSAQVVPGSDLRFESDHAAVYQEPRGIQYGLNFYFRRELPTWAEFPSAEWVFAGPNNIQPLEEAGFKCPRYIVFREVFPCEKTNSLPGPSGGRQPQ